MTATIRRTRALMGLAFEADARRARLMMVVLPFFLGGGLLGFALGFKLVVDAALTGDPAKGMLGGAVAAVSLSPTIAYQAVWGPLTLGLQERIGAVIDRRLMALTSAVPSLEVQDRPEYLSKLQLVIDERMHVTQFLANLVHHVVTLVLLAATVLVLALQHPLLVLLPVFALPTMWLTLAAERNFRRAQNETAEQARLGDALLRLGSDADAGKELRVFGLGDELLARHARARRVVHDALNRAAWTAAARGVLGWAIFTLAYAFAVLIVVQRAARGQASASDVVLVIAMAAPIIYVAGGAAGGLQSWLRSMTVAERYVWLEDLASEAARPSRDAAPIPASLKDGIRCERVGFTYPGSDRTALDDVTLDLPAGSVVALVGENGAGKTTLVKLLCRLYDPTSGQITVDGVDLSRLPAVEWRTRICASFQDFVRFETIARETVGLGDLPRISDGSAVSVAAERAGASDLLSTLPLGLETQLGKEWDGGIDLSSGQWQKFALSRGLMRDTPVLVVLDEPTAALDASAEHALFERFAQAARQGRTARDRVTLLVSHRFSTVRMADLIVVLDAGRVVESGSHDELVGRGGLYAQLFEIQARSYR